MDECRYCHGTGWVVTREGELPCLAPIHELPEDAPETATLKQAAAVLMRGTASRERERSMTDIEFAEEVPSCCRRSVLLAQQDVGQVFAETLEGDSLRCRLCGKSVWLFEGRWIVTSTVTGLGFTGLPIPRGVCPCCGQQIPPLVGPTKYIIPREEGLPPVWPKSKEAAPTEGKTDG